MLAASAFACVADVSYVGRLCDEDGTCPGGLVCNRDMRCVNEEALDASSAADADAGDQFADASMQDSSGTLDSSSSRDAALVDAGLPTDGGTACTEEICDGIDEDCDLRNDNGCPAGALSYDVNPAMTSLAGAGGQNTWTEDQGCPEGQVVTGLYGGAGVYVDRVGEHCGVPVVVENRSHIPFTYTFQIQPGATTDQRGGDGGGAYDLRCPINTAMTSIFGHGGSVIDQLSFECSSFEVTGTSPSTGFTIEEVGPRTPVAGAVGGAGGGMFKLDCPIGYAAGRLIGSDGLYDNGMMGTYGLVASIGAWCTRLVVETQ